jgi:hypothetical protein
MSRVIITGPTGGAPNRLEIRDFVKNEKFFSLYIQALRGYFVLLSYALLTFASRGDSKDRPVCVTFRFPDRRHPRSSLYALEWCW